ncbi:MAG: hypothetical protein ACLSB9_22755 [Hydrogeniiclostridium mannosilyticum]
MQTRAGAGRASACAGFCAARGGSAGFAAGAAVLVRADGLGPACQPDPVCLRRLPPVCRASRPGRMFPGKQGNDGGRQTILLRLLHRGGNRHGLFFRQMGRFGILLGLPFKRRGQYVDINGMYPGISRPVQGKWVFGALVEPDRRLGCAGGLGIRPWRRIGGLAWLGCRLYGGSGFLDRYGAPPV